MKSDAPFFRILPHYYYIAILFLCYVFSFDPKRSQRHFFQSILCRMEKCNLFLGTNVLLVDFLTILIHHFVLFFSILSQKEKFYVKRKNNTQSSCIVFYESDITMNVSNMSSVALLSNFQFSLIFSVLKKVARMNTFVHLIYVYPT